MRIHAACRIAVRGERRPPGGPRAPAGVRRCDPQGTVRRPPPEDAAGPGGALRYAAGCGSVLAFCAYLGTISTTNRPPKLPECWLGPSRLVCPGVSGPPLQPLGHKLHQHRDLLTGTRLISWKRVYSAPPDPVRRADPLVCMGFEPFLLDGGIPSWCFGGQPAPAGARLALIGDCSFAARQPKEKGGEKEWKEQKQT